MAQHDFTLDNANGAAFRADLNSAIEAIVTNSAGATAPSPTFADQWWADTSTNILKRRNNANTAWISVMSLTTGLIIGTDIQAYNANLAAIAGLTIVSGDILYGDASSPSSLARLAKGTDGQVLTLTSGLPSWAAASGGGLPSGYLSGLGLTNNGTDAAHDIDISAGECRDAADVTDITLSAITKQIDATWSAGTNAGGLSSSLTAPANDTWYHVFAIIVGGSADVGFDTSITAANLVADHSATAYRRLGSVLTDGSANIIAFVQSGDYFYWSNPPLDASSAASTSATTLVVTVPTGVRVMANLNVFASGGAYTYFSPTDVTDEAPSASAAPLGQTQYMAQIFILTDTSAQVRHREAVASGNTYISTIGWIDDRGK